jgi:hypothetical protein
MGGNALKTITTTRKSAEDYEKIKEYVLCVLDDKLGNTGINWLVPHEVPGKTSFGDLDVLITRQTGFDIREWILLTFKPDELVSNGGVYSFNIPGFPLAKDFQAGGEGSSVAGDFQIDFITTPAEQFEIHHFFLSWGDCGMLIGQIAHATGLRMGADASAVPRANSYALRFGQQGLFMSYSERPGMSDDLILSTDPRKICEFLGLDYPMWKRGFGSEGHIFHWLCESPYIHLVEFNRSRRAREMYMRFIEYVKETLEPPKQMPSVPALDAIITYFDKQSEFAEIQQKQADAVKRSEKFGAHLFSALGDIPGRELGQIIAGFKRDIPGDFKAWVLATDEPDIQQKVTEYLTDAGLLSQ